MNIIDTRTETKVKHYLKNLKFFERFTIDTSFLLLESTKWLEDPGYLRGLEIVENFRLINIVELSEERNNIFTRR